MEKELKEMVQQVRDMHIAIAGNPNMGTKGLLQLFQDQDTKMNTRMDDIENQIKPIKKELAFYRKFRWVLAGIIGGAGAGAGAVSGPSLKALAAKLIAFLLSGAFVTLFIVVIVAVIFK